jgi:hypothetical protein
MKSRVMAGVSKAIAINNQRRDRNLPARLNDISRRIG